MNIFPLVKRFQDIKKTHSSVVLKSETIFYDKCFREGSIFTVVGWREINKTPYLILSKGSWEGLISYDDFMAKMEKIEKF